MRSLAWLGTGWIPLPGERFESFGGKGDIYIPVPVIGRGGGGGGGGCRWSGHSWVAFRQKVRVLRDDW